MDKTQIDFMKKYKVDVVDEKKEALIQNSIEEAGIESISLKKVKLFKQHKLVLGKVSATERVLRSSLMLDSYHIFFSMGGFPLKVIKTSKTTFKFYLAVASKNKNVTCFVAI